VLGRGFHEGWGFVGELVGGWFGDRWGLGGWVWWGRCSRLGGVRSVLSVVVLWGLGFWVLCGGMWLIKFGFLVRGGGGFLFLGCWLWG